MRTFQDAVAVREQTPLLVGLVGPSGTGKTYSALRLATGIQRVSGGEIFMIDTEARRGLHYADNFRFRHVQFGAPFSPLDYLSAIEHCVSKGARVVIVDSMSHEHEGPGGVLEMHAAETERLARGDERKAERVKMLAWQKPKAERRRLINSILQQECNFIFCFRAKPKLKLVPGKNPEQMGYMPIAGDEFVYEMTVKYLLLPGADGRPTFSSEHEGESGMIKTPLQFRGLASHDTQLDETLGERMAAWAAGKPPAGADELLEALASVRTRPELAALEERARTAWKSLTAPLRERVKDAIADARLRVERAADEMDPEPGVDE